jgi:S-methylmethionine-dependent homocysteine/selenocysteine methylase
MFTLLENKSARAEMRAMFERYLETTAEYGFNALMGGIDYRASSDWGEKLGYSRQALADIQRGSIEYLRDIARPFAGQIPRILFAGLIGPRGDAYGTGGQITASEAEDYHSMQLESLRAVDVDVAMALTFNNIPEAIGVARAADKAGVPLCVSFSLDSSSRLNSGPSFREAIETTDAECGEARPQFYGLNCSHPLEMEPAIESGNWFERVRMLRPNAVMMEKIALCKIGHLEDGDPQELGEQMGGLAQRYAHIDIWGGCCGTCETHLGKIAGQVATACRLP